MEHLKLRGFPKMFTPLWGNPPYPLCKRGQGGFPWGAGGISLKGGIGLRHLPGWWCLLTILALGGASFQGLLVYKLERLNHVIANPDKLVVDENSSDALIFAKAMRLDHTGNSIEATRLYASLRNCDDRDLRARAYHNLGTIYLRDGSKHWNARGVLDYAYVSSQVELAKENYREALRLNPDDWDARFNLEYAWRITPPPKETPKSDFKATKPSVFSTLPGLPGGGP